jgi:hypothetical protein
MSERVGVLLLVTHCGKYHRFSRRSPFVHHFWKKSLREDWLWRVFICGRESYHVGFCWLVCAFRLRRGKSEASPFGEISVCSDSRLVANRFRRRRAAKSAAQKTCRRLQQARSPLFDPHKFPFNGSCALRACVTLSAFASLHPSYLRGQIAKARLLHFIPPLRVTRSGALDCALLRRRDKNISFERKRKMESKWLEINLNSSALQRGFEKVARVRCAVRCDLSSEFAASYLVLRSDGVLWAHVMFSRSVSGRAIGRCDCPAGLSGRCCYHLAAALLVHVGLVRAGLRRPVSRSFWSRENVWSHSLLGAPSGASAYLEGN